MAISFENYYLREEHFLRVIKDEPDNQAGIFAYARILGQPSSVLRRPFALRLVEALAALQVMAAAGGLGFMLGTGKLMT